MNSRSSAYYQKDLFLSNLSFFSYTMVKKRNPTNDVICSEITSSFSGFFLQINSICRDSHVCTHIA